MKRLFLFAVCFLAFSIGGKTQQPNIKLDTIKVVFENDKVKVTEYASTPGKDVCGKGKHSHAAHLSIFLTEAVSVGSMEVKIGEPAMKKPQLESTRELG